MNERIGQVSFPPRDEQQFNKPYSDTTAQVIDDEVRKLVSTAYERTKALLQQHAAILKQVAELLLAKETISQNDLAEIAGPRPFAVNPKLAVRDCYASGSGSAALRSIRTHALSHLLMDCRSTSHTRASGMMRSLLLRLPLPVVVRLQLQAVLRAVAPTAHQTAGVLLRLEARHKRPEERALSTPRVRAVCNFAVGGSQVWTELWQEPQDRVSHPFVGAFSHFYLIAKAFRQLGLACCLFEVRTLL
jgi:hypothetical protein